MQAREHFHKAEHRRFGVFFGVMALSVLLGRRQAIFTTIFTGIFGCLLVSYEILFEYLLMSLICGF